MRCSATSAERASASLAVLTGLAILGLMCALIFRSLEDITAALTVTRGAERALDRASHDLLTGTTGAAHPPGLHRRSVERSWGATSLRLRSIELHGPPLTPQSAPLWTRNTGPLPLFDTDSLFATATQCPSPSEASTEYTPAGTALTRNAAVAARTCTVLSTTPLRPERYTENLIGEGPFRFTPPTTPNAPPDIVASLGYVELRGDLSVNRPTIVFAGGDLFLHRLTTETATTPVTLIAATGRVHVSSVTGALRLRVIAYAGAYLPPDTTLAASPPLPPILPRRFLGLERGDE